MSLDDNKEHIVFTSIFIVCVKYMAYCLGNLYYIDIYTRILIYHIKDLFLLGHTMLHASPAPQQTNKKPDFLGSLKRQLTLFGLSRNITTHWFVDILSDIPKLQAYLDKNAPLLVPNKHWYLPIFDEGILPPVDRFATLDFEKLPEVQMSRFNLAIANQNKTPYEATFVNAQEAEQIYGKSIVKCDDLRDVMPHIFKVFWGEAAYNDILKCKASKLYNIGWLNNSIALTDAGNNMLYELIKHHTSYLGNIWYAMAYVNGASYESPGESFNTWLPIQYNGHLFSIGVYNWKVTIFEQVHSSTMMGIVEPKPTTV